MAGNRGTAHAVAGASGAVFLKALPGDVLLGQAVTISADWPPDWTPVALDIFDRFGGSAAILPLLPETIWTAPAGDRYRATASFTDDGALPRSYSLDFLVHEAGLDLAPPVVALSADPVEFDYTETSVVTFHAEDNDSLASVTLTAELPAPPGGAVDIPLTDLGGGDYEGLLNLLAAGEVRLVAEAVDGSGNSSEADILVTVNAPPDAVPPVVEFTAPSEETLEITAPTEIRGSASDEHLSKWVLDFAPADCGDGNSCDWTVLAEGTDEADDELLAAFDPTTLENGGYEICLTAWDLGGNVSADCALLTVRGDLKPGAVRLSFLDLSIPLAGVPVTVGRTYDSTDGARGDFGVGWRMSLTEIKMRDDLAKNIYITLPGGRRSMFRAKLVPWGLWCYIKELKYEAPSGIHDELEMHGEARVLMSGCYPTARRLGFFEDRSIPYDEWRGRRFTLTDKYGTAYETVTERYWEIQGSYWAEIVTDPDGVLTEERRDDMRNLIHRRDDRGNLVETIGACCGSRSYEYDGEGNRVAEIDPEGNRTEFFFDYAGRMTKTVYPDLTSSESIYDAAGRLTRSIDQRGKSTIYDYDAAGRKETLTTDRGVITYTYDDSPGFSRLWAA